MDKETIRKDEDKALEATKNTDWPVWVKHLIWYIIGGISAVLCMTQTGCASSMKQTSTAADGTITTTERVLILNGNEARDILKLYPIPTVNINGK